MRYSTPNVSILPFARHQNVGRQNRRRVSEHASPGLAWAIYPSRTPEPVNVSSTVAVSPPVAFHMSEEQPQGLAAVTMSHSASRDLYMKPFQFEVVDVLKQILMNYRREEIPRSIQ